MTDTSKLVSVSSNERLRALLRRTQAYIYSGPPRNPDHDSESVLSAEIRAALESNAPETGALSHASAALTDFMAQLGETMSMEDGTTPADYLQRARDIRELCHDHQTLPPWIPITERIPEPEVFVLCWDGYKTFVEWFGSKPDAGRGVTHWVPYRMPPRAASNMHDGRRAIANRHELKASEPQMAMLPNDHHPGPRCSCRECQLRYPQSEPE